MNSRVGTGSQVPLWRDHAATLSTLLNQHNIVKDTNPERLGDLVENGHVYLINNSLEKATIRFSRWHSKGYICHLGDMLEMGEDVFNGWFTKWDVARMKSIRVGQDKSIRVEQDQTHTRKYNVILIDAISKLDDRSIVSITSGNPFMTATSLEKLRGSATKIASLRVTPNGSQNSSLDEYRKAADDFYQSDICFEFHKLLVGTVYRYRQALSELGKAYSDSPEDTALLGNAIRRVFAYCQQLWTIAHSKAFEDHMEMLGHNNVLKQPILSLIKYYNDRLQDSSRSDGIVGGSGPEETGQGTVAGEAGSGGDDVDNESNAPTPAGASGPEGMGKGTAAGEAAGEAGSGESVDDELDALADGCVSADTFCKFIRLLVDHWQALENVIEFCDAQGFKITRDIRFALLDVPPPDPSIAIRRETWEATIHDLKDESGLEDFQDDAFLQGLSDWVTQGESRTIDTPDCRRIRANFKHAFKVGDKDKDGGCLLFFSNFHCEALLGSLMMMESEKAHPLCHDMKMCFLVCHFTLIDAQ